MVPNFDARSVLMFTALIVGGIAASHAQTTASPPSTRSASAQSGTAPAGRGGPTFGGSAALAAPATAKAPAPVARDTGLTFDRNDTDKDGRLSRKETQALPAVADRFDAIDKNHDGFLSRAEMDAVASPAATVTPLK